MTAEEAGVQTAPQIHYLDGALLMATVLPPGEGEGEAVRVSLPSEPAAEGIVAQGDLTERPAPGAQLEVYVEQLSSESPPVYLVSAEKAARLAMYRPVEAAFKAGEVVEGELVSTTEGGYVVDLMGIAAFCPASQVGLRPPRSPQELYGRKLSFKIIRFNRERHNVVLSRRVLLEAERERTMKKLKEGAILDGRVRSLTDFGAFVDLGGVEGLLHISDMSWGRVGHPSKLVSVGDKLVVKVLKLENKGRRISLGLKQLEDDPWLTAAERYPAGSKVQGMVVSRTDFGCFLEVEPGVDGLIHASGPMVSAQAQRAIAKIQIGDELEAEVYDIDRSARRMSLLWIDPSA